MTLVSFLKMLDQISLIQGCLRNLKKRNAKITTCNEKTHIEIPKIIKIYRKKTQVIQKNSVTKKTKVKCLNGPYTLSLIYV